MPPIPRNPYIAGKALGDPRGFFGRADVFQLVQTVLSSPDQNSVVLFGQRRIGKTSILLNLRSQLPSPPFVPVYFDLMDRARKSLADVSFELAATIAQELQLPQPARADFDNEGRGFREKFLPSVYAALGDNRLVLLFDEFDVLNVGAEEKLAPTSAAFAFFPYLRDLMTNEPRLGFVFVVGRKAEELGIEFKAAFKASRFARVSVLDDESARALIRTAEGENKLLIYDDAVTRILELTACHPYFTQLTCQLLFERAYAEPSNIEITRTDVDAIVPKVLEAGENIFEWIWDGLPPAERVIFSAIASGTDEQTVITEERLIAILQSQGIRILIRELELAPKTLVEWEMLKQTDGGYKFFVELMRRWVVARKSLDKVKDELDRVVPLADMLYQAANGFYRRGDLDRAITQLQSALNVNPNHLKARLLLGEIYRAQGKLDDAVRELEVAHQIDETASRISFENTLLQRADYLEKQNEIDGAIRDYSQILEISPDNQVTKEHRAKLEFLRRKRELDNLATKVETLLNQEKWEESVAVYEQLIGIDSENLHWLGALEKAKQEREIAQRYTEGIVALQQRQWAVAQRAFADVVYQHPDYKIASELLMESNQKLKARQWLGRFLFLPFRATRVWQNGVISGSIALILICLLFTGITSFYLQVTSYEMAITNKNCYGIPLPTGLPIPGLQVPAQIHQDQTEIIKLPRVPVKIASQSNELWLTILGISMQFPATQIQGSNIILDGKNLLTESASIDLGTRPRHELIITCR